MRVLVCGGRDYRDWMNVYDVLNQYWINPRRIDVIIQGGAKGADTFAKQYAENNDIYCEEYLPDWDKYGKAAGHIRNKQMLDEGKPDLVIAFPGGRGTANMIEQAEKAGVEVEVVNI